ncbi:olfactory receptor 14A16-like [Rhea pennata]|uniref:olfactory receptor 14A16-like n=1 Tax=Rhea pennata TaxID=8795 RepID=UPI002E26C93A
MSRKKAKSGEKRRSRGIKKRKNGEMEGRGKEREQFHVNKLLVSMLVWLTVGAGVIDPDTDTQFKRMFLFLFLLGGEYCLLIVMAYEHYIAICTPLHYSTLMDSRACAKMAAAAWASGFLHALLHTANTFSISLCQGNTVDQFFCEIPQILKLSCSDAYFREIWLLMVSGFLFFGCFVCIVLTYVQIFTAVLRIPSEQGRHKACSMCLPHLTVVSLFVSTGIFAYLKPPSLSSPALDLVVAVLYSVLPPTLNPLIYSMRNKELKDVLRKLIQRILGQQQ